MDRALSPAVETLKYSFVLLPSATTLILLLVLSMVVVGDDAKSSLHSSGVIIYLYVLHFN